MKKIKPIAKQHRFRRWIKRLLGIQSPSGMTAWREIDEMHKYPADFTTMGARVVRCSECDYYKRATEPAEITQATPPNRYYHEIEYLENVVLVVLYEATEAGPVELARAHGHIIHEGAEGIAQATSYAMKGIWYKVLDPFMGSGTK